MKEHTYEFYKFTPRTLKLAFMTVVVVPGAIYWTYKDWFVILLLFKFRAIDSNQWVLNAMQSMIRMLKIQWLIY
jgi:hypothetical protein